MPRAINLRQIEIFKALIEHGTVSRAAEMLYISQPAASKLLMQLEGDNALRLFDRHKGRLTPTTQGLRLYEEIGRIFAGVRQVEGAIAFIRREDQSRLVIGVIPALAGAFVQRATMNFLKNTPNVYCSIESLNSQWIVNHVTSRAIDVGIISSRIDNPYIATESLLEHPLLCIMPIGHPLAAKSIIRAEDLRSVPFISFKADSYTGQMIAQMFEECGVNPNIALTADASPTVCEFVAAGFGVSILHPLFVAGMEDRLTVRQFEPGTPLDFQICYARDARNIDIIGEFVRETKAMAQDFIAKLTRDWL